MRIFAITFILSALFNTPVLAEDRSWSDGASNDGCVITEALPRRDGGSAEYARTVDIDPCSAVGILLERPPVSQLQRAANHQRLREIAKFLRANPDVTVTDFTVIPTALEATAACCTCVPGQSCSGSFFSVCDITTTGTCPSGTIRAICNIDAGGIFCTGID